ncbi:adenosylcobinamide-GDP ribazoletransferase [Nonomuraea insulae]|uniref:Adenosylcobinamide-GDP ribazoletransferase n=1 Tax=Nonomuraea insulae TaxID=1616787 RepID=A0ABW1D5D5_9ACTN
MRLMDGLRFALGTLTVFPVRVERVDRQVAGDAMVLAPAVGLVLGAVAGVPLLLPVPPLLGAALALGLLALLSRGLHLDGLADLADGLGSGKPPAQALDIMKKSDIGPFGVMTLLFTLVIQVVALAEGGYWALVTACVAGRLALTWACRSGVPAARPDGLGAMVAGTVRRPAAWLATLAALLAAAAIGLLTAPGAGLWAAPRDGSLAPGIRDLTVEYAPPVVLPAFSGLLVPPLALLAGLGAALLLLGHARRRLGGITGDVLGALVESAVAATLVVCVILQYVR